MSSIITGTLQFEEIDDLICQRISLILNDYCITSLTGVADATANGVIADEIRPGLFQDSPVKKRINIMIYPGDPDDMGNDPKDSARIGASNDNVDQRMMLEPFELDGSQTDIHNFVAEIQCNFTRSGENRATASKRGAWIIGRVKQAIRDIPELGIKDDFGCFALLMYVHAEHRWEEGGPPKDFIWRAKVRISVPVYCERGR